MVFMLCFSLVFVSIFVGNNVKAVMGAEESSAAAEEEATGVTQETEEASGNETLKTDKDAGDGKLESDEDAENGKLESDEDSEDGKLESDKDSEDGTLESGEGSEDGTLESDEDLEDGTLEAGESSGDETLETDERAGDGTLETDGILPEELTEKDKKLLDQEAQFPAFHDSAEADGIRIEIGAPEGVLPEGAYFEAVGISDTDRLSRMSEAIEKDLQIEKIRDILAFDISICNKDGEVIQPDTENGSVTVSIEDVYDSIEEEENLSVFYVSDDGVEAEEVSAVFHDGNAEFETEHFSTYAVVRRAAMVQNRLETSAWAPSITDITLIKGDDADSGTEIPTTGGTLKSTDSIWMKCRFNINLDFSNPGDKAIADAGIDYPLMNVPEALKLKNTSAWTISTKGITIGTVTPGSSDSKSLSFQFASDLTTKAEGLTIESVWVNYNAQLDMDQIGNDEKTEILFTTTPQKTYMVLVDDNIPKDPEIKKTGIREANGKEISWEITVVSQGKDFSTVPFTLKDTLGKYQSYQIGSFYYITPDGKRHDVTEPDPQLTISRDSAANIQSLTYANDSLTGTEFTERGKEMKFGYKTTVNNSVLANDGSDQMVNGGNINVKITNSAQLMADGKQIGNTASAAVLVNDAQTWISKIGNKVANSNVGEMEWIITINTNGYGSSFESITLHDRMESPLSLKSGSLEYRIDSNQPVPLADSLFQTSGTDLFLNGNDGYGFTGLDGVKNIVVTYHTAFATPEDYTKYLKENHTAPNNNAWLDFVWRDYYGPGTGMVKRGIPTLIAPSGLTQGSLAKKGEYDASTHTITWTISVNQNAVSLNDVVIKDVLGDKQSYVSGSLSAVAGQLPNCSGSGTAADPLQFTLGSINTAQEFTYRTEVMDPEFYANNKTQNYTNTATLYEGATELATSSPQVSCVSKVIEKKADGYSFDSNRIKWQVTVNENKMEMTNVSFEDTLSAGLSLCEETGTITYQVGNAAPQNLTTSVGSGYYYVYSGNCVRVHLPDMTVGAEPVTVAYYTDVDVDSFSDLIRKLEPVNISNQAVLYNSQWNGSPSGEAWQQIPSRCLVKTGKIPPDDKNCIEYMVEINPHRAALPNTTFIQDTLPVGLQLQLPSVKLYEANVAADGSMTAAAAVGSNQFRTTSSLEADGRTSFKLTLPSGGGKKAYIMVYRAAILDLSLAPFSNSVSMSGMEAGQKASNEMTKDYIVRNGGGGSLHASTRIQIAKVDEDTLAPLEGAVFQLLYEGNVVKEDTTDVSGIVVFYGLSKGEVYSVREVTAPAGYYTQTNDTTLLPALSTGVNKVTITNSTTPPAVQKPDAGHSQNHSSGSSGSSSDSGGNENYGSSGSVTGQAPAVTEPTEPVAPILPKTDTLLSARLARRFVLPNSDEAVTGEAVMEKVAAAMQIRDQKIPMADAKALRSILQAVVEQEPHFFDSAPENMQRYVAGILASSLPKTGESRRGWPLVLIGGLIILASLWKRKVLFEKIYES